MLVVFAMEALAALVLVKLLCALRAGRLLSLIALSGAPVVGFILFQRDTIGTDADRGWASLGAFLVPVGVYLWIGGAGKLLHTTISGKADRRYKHNPFVYEFSDDNRRVALMGFFVTILSGVVTCGVTSSTSTTTPTTTPPPLVSADAGANELRAPTALDAGTTPTHRVAKGCFLRTAPLRDAGTSGEVVDGQQVTVLDRGSEWARVATPSGEGWLHRSCLK